MSEFTNLVAVAGAEILSRIGVEAIFTPAAGDPVTLTVSFSEEILIQPDAIQAKVYGQTKTIEYLYGDIARAAAEGETFTIGATVYTVSEVLADDGMWVKCAVR